MPDDKVDAFPGQIWTDSVALRSPSLLVILESFCQPDYATMKKVNLNDVPWRERKSPKGKYHRFLRDVALAFQNPKTGPSLLGQPPFEVELVRLPPGAKNFPF